MVIHDLTEREAAEAALHESEELYRSILKASPDDITSPTWRAGSCSFRPRR